MQGFLPHLCYHLVALSPHDPAPSRGVLSLRVGLEVMQAIFRNDFEARFATAIARLAALGDSDLIVRDVAPILIYANRVHADLTVERLEHLVDAALPDLRGEVMGRTFQQYIDQGYQVGLQEGHQVGSQEARQAGVEEGLQVGFHEAIKLGLELKFGAEGHDLLPEIQPIHDLATLRALSGALPRIQTVDELRAWLQTTRVKG